MQKAVIFIADSNPVGPGHKLILPAIRYWYVKRGIQCRIIDPYRSGYDPTVTNNMGPNAFNRDYKHAIKTATHLHFITSSHLNGLNPVLEGIFEHVLVNGFAYNRSNNKRKRMINKKVNFHVIYNHDIFRFNPLWFRLKFIILRQIFKGGSVFQYNPTDFSKLKNKGITQKIHKFLSKQNH